MCRICFSVYARFLRSDNYSRMLASELNTHLRHGECSMQLTYACFCDVMARDASHSCDVHLHVTAHTSY